jgi:hypothetical protein
MDISFSGSNVPYSIHNFGEPDILRAMLNAVMTNRTQPDKIATQNLIPHTQQYHAYYLTRVVFVSNLPDCTASAARTTLKATHYVLTSRLGGNLVLEFRVQFVH